MEFNFHVSEPWFTLIKLKLKTIEGEFFLNRKELILKLKYLF